jgi:acyl-coenzyme A thioesterase PaaI-like protein
MDITKIPFNKYLNIVKSNINNNSLELAFNQEMKNHIGTFHASAQFALAEACSGLALQNQFAEFADSAVPVLRKVETKFKKPASSGIKAEANTDSETAEKFKLLFEKKGRATIQVPVEVVDEKGVVTMVGNYEWFVQKL